jgi:HK97 family phage major capsid protein
MTKKTKDELQVRYREIQDRMSELNVTAAEGKREFNDEEKREWNALSRESELVMMDLQSQMTSDELAKHREQVNKGEQLREYLRQTKEAGAKREILLWPASPGSTGNITASGAIELSIHEMIPTLHEGLDLPATLKIVTGVTGNELWPVSVNDVEMEEVGEVEALSDQILNFANITPVQNRVGLKVPISNMAIDNAAFDLMAFVQAKFTLALKKYLAKKIYSQAAWEKNKGPFSGLTKTGDIDLGANAYKSILKAVAKFSDKGFFEGDVVLIMDRETEAELKATPKIAGAAGGFVIENGRCAGYPYVVTHYLNTTLSGTTLVPTAKKFIGFGYFEWFALQQHGQVRMVVDPVTLADKGVTRVILNTAWSMTDLSTRINGGTPVTDGQGNTTYPTQAFALYEVVGGDESISDL